MDLKTKVLYEIAIIKEDWKNLTLIATAGALTLGILYVTGEANTAHKAREQERLVREERFQREKLEDFKRQATLESKVRNQWANYAFKKEMDEFNREMQSVYNERVDQYIQEEPKTRAKDFPKLDSEFKNKYKKLIQYKSLVEKEVNYYNKKFKFQQKLDPNYIMAILMKEAGHGASLDKDPMQIANQGDHALRVFQKGEEYSWQIKKIEGLKNIKSTKIKNYKRTYDPNLTPQKSIEVGIAYVIQRAAIRNNQGTIISWRPWKNAIHRYNGGGVENYSNDVLDIHEKLTQVKYKNEP
jgi:hypothetical protein